MVLHRVSDIHILHPPSVSLELVDDDPSEVLFIDGVVRTEGGGVVVEDDRLVLMVLVVGTKVRNERGDFALELGVERLYHIQPLASSKLACDDKRTASVKVAAFPPPSKAVKLLWRPR